MGYVKSDLMIPEELSVADLKGANAKGVLWCNEVNAQVHSEIAAIPAERLAQERPLLGALPSLRARIGQVVMRKVDRLSCVRFGSARFGRWPWWSHAATVLIHTSSTPGELVASLPKPRAAVEAAPQRLLLTRTRDAGRSSRPASGRTTRQSGHLLLSATFAGSSTACWGSSIDSR